MDNNVDALKALYIALGGSADDLAEAVTIPEIITAIAGKIYAGGVVLPSVKSTDNGKVLTVVSGKWKAQTPST